ncbi:MAG: twin-arginine translocase subunit TatB [Syntrophomonadaceae bacterium]|jgi:Tat protein translocase TatB subunit|nr:twin-arginine translocase subunit TatB [Syntrophomonadaceae bacterium]
MFNIGPWELILILVVALIVVGPGKLPEVAKSLGKATREFKKATTGIKKEFDEAIKSIEETSQPPKAQNQPMQEAKPTAEAENGKE